MNLFLYYFSNIAVLYPLTKHEYLKFLESKVLKNSSNLKEKTVVNCNLVDYFNFNIMLN